MTGEATHPYAELRSRTLGVQLRDLDIIGNSAFRVEHLASEAIFVEPTTSTIDTLSWLEANDFDEAPLRGTWPPRVVTRDRLRLRAAQPESVVGSEATEVSPDRTVPGSLGLRDAIDRLREHRSVLVCDNEQVIGIATAHDLSRPIVSVYAFALVTAFERGLRRLLGSYTHEPMTDWASGSTEGDDLGTLATSPSSSPRAGLLRASGTSASNSLRPGPSLRGHRNGVAGLLRKAAAPTSSRGIRRGPHPLQVASLIFDEFIV